MGCCVSSPYSRRIYDDPTDLQDIEKLGPLRTFGKWRNNSNVVPDDIEGLPVTHLHQHLAAVPSELLYDAEIDQGIAFRCLRPIMLVYCCPPMWIHMAAVGIQNELTHFNCDEICCWVRKEYSSRAYIRVYSNRIEINRPKLRWFGTMGCGSWNTDNVTIHLFDRGAFGFRRLPLSFGHVCLCCPIYGGVVGRQRCACNGSLWPRIMSDCGGWWCDEWCCNLFFCTYKYVGLGDPDEFAFAASISLQAYFEGRLITKEDMDQCIAYWKDNIEETPVDRRRPVCCEPYSLNCPLRGQGCYEYCTHPQRQIPTSMVSTKNMEEAYTQYENLRLNQIRNYKENITPRRLSTFCQLMGCQRFAGRKGFLFCTEDIDKCCTHKAGDPAPPFFHEDIDDENDAARILQIVLGDPPRNVVYKRSPLLQPPKSQTLMR